VVPFAPQASGLVEDRIADFVKRDVLVAYDFRRYQPETIAFCQAASSRRKRPGKTGSTRSTSG